MGLDACFEGPRHGFIMVLHPLSVMTLALAGGDD